MSLKSYSSQHQKKCLRGASLIEILVTVLIVSVGLLGVAGMQVTGLRNNQNAYFRTQASFLAYTMLDRMQANQVAARAGSYDIDLTDTHTAVTTIAEQDLTNWKNELSSTLPSGQGAVSYAASTQEVNITVSWDERSQTTTFVLENIL